SSGFPFWLSWSAASSTSIHLSNESNESKETPQMLEATCLLKGGRSSREMRRPKGQQPSTVASAWRSSHSLKREEEVVGPSEKDEVTRAMVHPLESTFLLTFVQAPAEID